jgi:glycosidase|tara:strand:- start:2329 stop:4173 length:1845 start_codon:yes stop_codon:yes gene_type:complete
MKNIIKILLILISINLHAQKIERIEPENWWVGMKHSNVQLLVYGENIGNLQPKLQSESISLERTIKVENPNYLFLYISIKENAKSGIIPIHFYDKNELKITHDFKLLAREEGRGEIEGFNTSDVMYLITPDRFADGDPSNNAIAGMPDIHDRDDKGARHGGDIKGMSDNLNYIVDMGFTAIWVNPVLENNMPSYSYHGYAATDFYKIDRRFGTNKEYKDFCEKASEKGVKIIMDMILNHSGSEHWFVLDPPTSDWINFQDKYTKTSHRRNTIQDIYASVFDKKAFSDGWFVKTMPDLNQKNELMSDYVIQNTIWWIEYSGISGIRMDTYPYPDKDFMTIWTCAVMDEYPKFNIVGEEWVTNPAIVSYWQGGKTNHDGYTSCLPSLMDFPIQDAIVKGLTQEEKKYGSGLIETYKMLTMDFLYPDPNNLVIFPDNHDMDRFFTQVNEDLSLFKMGMAYISTMRGIPQIYYGTEVLMENSDAPNDHGIIRSDFPGGWKGDLSNAITGEGLSNQQIEAQKFVKNLMKWRKKSEVIHHGKLMQFTPENGVYVFFRYLNDKKVMVVLNKNESETVLELSRFNEILDGSISAKDIISGTSYSLDKPLFLPNKSALILEIN